MSEKKQAYRTSPADRRIILDSSIECLMAALRDMRPTMPKLFSDMRRPDEYFGYITVKDLNAPTSVPAAKLIHYEYDPLGGGLRVTVFKPSLPRSEQTNPFLVLLGSRERRMSAEVEKAIERVGLPNVEVHFKGKSPA